MSEEKKKKIFIPLMPSVPRQHTSNQPFFETTIDSFLLTQSYQKKKDDISQPMVPYKSLSICH